MSEDVVSLIEEGGRERSFRVHDVVELEGSTYYVVEAADEVDQVLVLREAEGGLDALQGEELDRVLDELERLDGAEGDVIPGEDDMASGPAERGGRPPRGGE